MPGVSVALPVHRDPGTLARAFACITGQTLVDLDILLVLNGADEATRRTGHALVRSDARARLIELPEANLAAALNVAVEAARFPLVARMDADDTCPPHRFALQAGRMEADPALDALGAAWEIADDAGRVIATVRPPTDPAAMRWRLLLGNVLAHGSVMLRREPVLRAGGYDTRCTRAQDYDLWLRLSRHGAVAALPEVLYRHTARDGLDIGRSTRPQAEVAAARMLDAWRSLPAAGDDTLRDVGQTLIAATAREGGAPASIAGIERVLTTSGPSREALLAWLWAQWFHPAAPRRAVDAGRLALLREAGARFRALGVRAVWIWGAGDHTRWLLEHTPELALPVAGLVDDHAAGQERLGHTVRRPADLRPGDWALISSDWHEDAIWESSAPHRARGVHIARLYGGGS